MVFIMLRSLPRTTCLSRPIQKLPSLRLFSHQPLIIKKKETMTQEEKKIYDQAFKEGLNIGTEVGKHAERVKEGYQEGFEEGFKAGRKKGHEEGFNEGEEVGYGRGLLTRNIHKF